MIGLAAVIARGAAVGTLTAVCGLAVQCS